jgi:hypothetical protein
MDADPEQRGARERVVEQFQAAHRELVQMCKRQWNGQPAIRWSIPSEKADSDVIVGDALREAIALLKEEFQKTTDAS